MNTPIVSVLLPVYGVEKYIDECIDSILSQDYPALEVIFVDDCSPDGSAAIIERRLPELDACGWSARLIHNAENKGSATSRNVALDYASGQYICFLDPDDLLPSGAISRTVKAALEHEADIVRGDIMRFSPQGELPFEKRPPIDIMEYRLACLDWGTTHVGVCGGIIKSDLFRDNDIRFYDGLNFGEDFGVTTRLAYYARKVAFVEDAVYRYRINPLSMTQSYKEIFAQNLIETSDRVEAFYKRKPDYNLYAETITRGRARMKTIMLLQLAPEVSPRYARIFPELKNARLPFVIRLRLTSMEHNLRTVFKIINKIQKLYHKIR